MKHEKINFIEKIETNHQMDKMTDCYLNAVN